MELLLHEIGEMHVTREAEIDQDRCATRAKQYVRGLEIEVQHVLF